MQLRGMVSFEEALEQLVIRKQAKGSSSPISSSDFYRLSRAHFASNVLPELERFEDCLKRQGVGISLASVVQQSIVRATLTVERPAGTYHLLLVVYDFGTRSLVFELAISGVQRETRERYPISTLVHVTPLVVYGLIEAFVASIFSTESLCEYSDDDPEA